ncbi:hypothetical protein L873DRAFT_1800071 [Choiromyces venosus 120613-1]|uniref:Uncharacterized protein n=1 Tax=Choiromyces venosus 120613-1 TaxID=1336337 RepID=A0A3N4K0H1_9PEZI|nr:hypothetical protein L873DRAFT_1800071 [Choiromyces venosus 120613-1]
MHHINRTPSISHSSSNGTPARTHRRTLSTSVRTPGSTIRPARASISHQLPPNFAQTRAHPAESLSRPPTAAFTFSTRNKASRSSLPQSFSLPFIKVHAPTNPEPRKPSRWDAPPIQPPQRLLPLSQILPSLEEEREELACKYVNKYMPIGYWAGRFGSLTDRMCAERPGNWEKERARRAFLVLEGYAIGKGRESLLEFKSQYEATMRREARRM